MASKLRRCHHGAAWVELFPFWGRGRAGPLLPPGLGGQPSLLGRGPWVQAGPWRPEVLGVNLHFTCWPRRSAFRSVIVPCCHAGRWHLQHLLPRDRREALPPGSTEHGAGRPGPQPGPGRPGRGRVALWRGERPPTRSTPVPTSTRGGEGQSCNLPILGDRAQIVPRTASRLRVAIPTSVSDTVASQSG